MHSWTRCGFLPPLQRKLIFDVTHWTLRRKENGGEAAVDVISVLLDSVPQVRLPQRRFPPRVTNAFCTATIGNTAMKGESERAMARLVNMLLACSGIQTNWTKSRKKSENVACLCCYYANR